MPERIYDYDAAIEEMLRWANGEKSHWNDFNAAVGQFLQSSSEATTAAMADCARADAAEVQKWAAVVSALRDDKRPIIYGSLTEP